MGNPLEAARHYGPEDAGPPCAICRLPVVLALVHAGIRVHPSCAEVDS